MHSDDAARLGADDFARAGLEPDAFDSEALIDIEHEGRPFRIPAALQGAFLAKGDLERQSQDLAGHRRRLDDERKAWTRNVELAHATARDRVRLADLDEDLAVFEGLDWQAFAAAEPEEAEALWAQYQQMADARERFAWHLSHQEEQSRLEVERRLADDMASAGEELMRDIQGWSPDIALKLVDYAQAFGVTLEELREVADARLWKILHKAHQGEELLKQQESARRTATTQAVRPAVQVTGAGAQTAGVRDELGTAEWMRRRNERATAGR
jgi:hypothetical protein